MNKPDLYRAKIPQIADESPRPLWSVMIPTYNCSTYLRETLTGVLAQDPGPDWMQIAVVDDGSTQDDPQAVVEELGQGRVEFYRQPQNVGYINNFATCLQRSRGHLIHLLHGDDSVLDGFYQKMQQLFEQYPTIGAAFCRHIIIDDQSHWQSFSRLEQADSGILNHWLERIAVELPLQPPTMVVRRHVYENLGGFDNRMSSCGEDWEMWVRIASQYPVAYQPEPLALYRDRSGSLTKRAIVSGQNIRDVYKATEITYDYLPQTRARILTRLARESWADWAFYFSQKLIDEGKFVAAFTQAREGLRCSRSSKSLRQLAFLCLYGCKQWLYRLMSDLHPKY